MYIEVKTLPDTIRYALESLGYHRADISVEVSDKARIGMAFGDGYRGVTCLVNIVTGEMKAVHGSWGGENPFENNPFDTNSDARPALPENVACIYGSTGYKVLLSMVLHPKNAAPLLPVKSTISERDRSILEDFCGLTSAGRKNEWERYPSKRPTNEEIASLVERGYLKQNKAGATAITTAGRNAARG